MMNILPIKRKFGIFISFIMVCFVIALFALIITGLFFSQSAPDSEFSKTAGADTEIRLDFHPFQDSVSSFVFLRADGNARIIRFNRSQLTIASAFEGKLPEEIVTRLLSKLQDSAFQKALERKNFSGNGLSQGDQFFLSIKNKGQAAKDVFGFVSDTPTVVSSLIEELLGLEKQLAKVSLAEAYIVSKPVEKERFDKLRKEKKTRLALLNEIPSSLQSIAETAINNPHDFHALSKQQYEQFLSWSSQSHEFFVDNKTAGHQLTLFKLSK